MGKNQKYSSDLLLEAVVLYHASFPNTIINSTKLAEWARQNVEGLEGVEYYHFTRTMTQRNKKGEKVEIEKECSIRIREYNEELSAVEAEMEMKLISATNPQEFLALSDSSKIREIEIFRKLYREKKRRCNKLAKENEALVMAYDNVRSQLSERDNQIEMIEKVSSMQKKLDKKLSFIISNIDEMKRRDILAEVGIVDGDYDILKEKESIDNRMTELFNIKEVITQRRKEEQSEAGSLEDFAQLIRQALPPIED